MVNTSLCLGVALLFITAWITCINGSSIDLTVKGGVSLVGPQCPENVRLFCEGEGLTSLRWRYNGNRSIVSYFPDGRSIPQPDESAFFFVQLMRVEQDQDNPNIANFSSFLTANFSQLQSNNVTEILCDTPGMLRAVPVNVSIIKPGIPSTPAINMVTATYQSGELNSIEVKWAKSDNFCSVYGITFLYEVNITAFDSNRLSCSDESNCVTSFSNLTGRTNEFGVSVRADNEFGTSDRVVYPTIIAHQVQQYVISEVFVNNRQLFGRCKTVGGPLNPIECSLQYTSDPLYRNLSTKLIAPLDTDISVPEIPVPEKTYYFQFTVLVTDTFQVTNRIASKFSFQPDAGALSEESFVLVIVIASLVLLATVIIVIVIPLLCWKARQRKNVKVTVKFRETASETMSSVNKNLIYYNKYNVVVMINGKTYDPLIKRYRDFEQLAKQLKRGYNRTVKDQNLTLPQSNLVDRPTNDFDSEDNQRETDELQQFMEKVVKIQGILKFPPVHEFLALSDKGINLNNPTSEENTVV